MAIYKITDPIKFDGGHRTHSLDYDYTDVLSVLGEPFRNWEPDFPDDTSKVDVCWMLMNERGDKLAIWNYKNGPAYASPGEGVSLEDIDGFSVYCDNEDFYKELEDVISHGDDSKINALFSPPES